MKLSVNVNVLRMMCTASQVKAMAELSVTSWCTPPMRLNAFYLTQRDLAQHGTSRCFVR